MFFLIDYPSSDGIFAVQSYATDEINSSGINDIFSGSGNSYKVFYIDENVDEEVEDDEEVEEVDEEVNEEGDEE